MAGKKKTKKKAGFTLSLATVAGFVPLGQNVARAWKHGGIETAGNELAVGLTGYDPNAKVWRANNLMKGAGPIAIGLIAHKVFARLGINRMLARAKVPFIRL